MATQSRNPREVGIDLFMKGTPTLSETIRALGEFRMRFGDGFKNAMAALFCERLPIETCDDMIRHWWGEDTEEKKTHSDQPGYCVACQQIRAVEVS